MSPLSAEIEIKSATNLGTLSKYNGWCLEGMFRPANMQVSMTRVGWVSLGIAGEQLCMQNNGDPGVLV